MVMTLAIIARKAFGLENYITIDHFDKMCKIILATGLIVSYSYIVELFMSWYSGNIYERFTFMNRAFGPYAWAFWIMICCNVFVPQIFWFKKARNTVWVLFVASILINIGMWFERFVIIVTSLAHDFLPSSWHYYKPTIFDIGMLVGSFGVFLTLFLLFLRVLPMIAMSEVKAILPQASAHHLDGGGIKFETEKNAG